MSVDFDFQMLIQLNISGKIRKRTSSAMVTAMIAVMAIMYLRFERLISFDWPASDRFFLHLPDFVLSLSFDHLPFFTRGTGKITLPC